MMYLLNVRRGIEHSESPRWLFYCYENMIMCGVYRVSGWYVLEEGVLSQPKESSTKIAQDSINDNEREGTTAL